ncbi:hypothetical protein GCM10009677_48240 [Sphaerisporangium rubeum]
MVTEPGLEGDVSCGYRAGSGITFGMMPPASGDMGPEITVSMCRVAWSRNVGVQVGSTVQGATSMLLVYDGDCGFCRLCLDFARKYLPFMPRVSAWQGLDLARHGLTLAQVNASVQLLGPDGMRAHGARAVGILLAVQPSLPWRILGNVALTPPISWVAEVVYRLVSRYRHRLPGGTGAGTCGIGAK